MTGTIVHNQPAATCENTVFLTVAAYTHHEEKTAAFCKSAEDHGIPIILCDVGEPWQGFYHHKIAVMGERLKRLREEAGKQFAFILDCRDVVFIEPLESVLAKFNALNDGRMVFNHDIHFNVYPHRKGYLVRAMETAMRSQYARLNAGMVAGNIDTILKVQQHTTVLRQELMEGCPRPGILERLYQDIGKKFGNDDQYLYHVCLTYYPELFRLDYGKELFAHLTAYPKDIRECSDNPKRHDVINAAALIHSPRLARGQHWKRMVFQNRWQR